VNNVSDQYLQLTNPISVVAGAQLIFWHSYNLENTFDGGVLEASTNGGTTWTDMGPNITTGGYNGTISSSFGSPIAGRQAWTGNSTGYIQTTVSLTPYVGWSLLFRFRLATDNTLATPGWRVDDIGVTGSCATGTPVLTSTAVPTSVDTVVPATSTGAPTHTATEEPTGEPTATATPIEACSLEFSDVQPGTTFYSYVQCLACIGVISGYSDGTFHPDAPLTRGQLAKLVSNAAGYDEELTTQTFEDVLPGSTFYQYVERMASRGILGGYPCGDPTEPCVSPDDRPYFRPYINANRGQITKIVANAANMMGQSPSEGQMFEDVATGSTFFDYVQMLGSHGIMGGYLCGGEGEPCGPDNMPYFRPGSEATRGQLSKIVTNTFFPGCQVR
jgi:hypothetical protein